MKVIAKTSRKKPKTATNALGAKLLESAQQALHAASTGNLAGITIREVEIAAAAHVGGLLLTHLNPSIDEARDAVLASIRRSYAGPVTFARDGMHATP